MAEESPPEDDLHEDISAKTDLKWGPDSFSISKILRKYQLPLLVMVAEGNYGINEMQTISANEVIKIESILAVDYVEASVIEDCNQGDQENRDERLVSSFPSTIALPKTLTSISLEIIKGQTHQSSNITLKRSMPKKENNKSSLWRPTRLNKKTKMKFTSVRSLSKYRPKVVRVIKLPPQMTASPDLSVGNELLILDVIECQRLAVKYLRCRLRENNEPQKIIKLNLKWTGIYETVPEPQFMHLKDLTSFHGLPVTVRIREASSTRGKWMNPKATSLIKQIRTLDIHLRLGQEATTYFAIGVVGGGNGNKKSVVIMSTNSDVLLRVSPEMEEKTEKYQKLMTSYTGVVDVEIIPPEIFIRELKCSVFLTVPLWELESWNVKVRNKKSPFLRRSLTSVSITEPPKLQNHSYINVDSSFQDPNPPNEVGKEISPTLEKLQNTKNDSDKTPNCYADEPLPIFTNALDSDKSLMTSSNQEEETGNRDQTTSPSTQVTSHRKAHEYHVIPDTDDTKTNVKKHSSKRDSMPRSVPPPVPYRRRKSKSSKSSWLSSFRRNVEAENRPLPDVPKDTTTIMPPSGIYITPTSKRVNADVIRGSHHKSRSSSSSRKKSRRKSANDMMSSSRDHSPSGSALSIDSNAGLPHLPPRTPSLEKLDKLRSKSGKRSKELRDPLSPRSVKDRLVTFEGDIDAGLTSTKHRSKVRRHHSSSSKHKHGEKKDKTGHRRKMSAPSIMEQTDMDAHKIDDHTFEDATDYLIPNNTREDSNKEDTDDATSLTSSVTSPTVLTFPSPLKPCRKSNPSTYISTKRVRLPERTFNSPAELPRDMSELTCGELGQALRLLHMREETVELFAKHLVNGALLEKMDADILKSEFELTHFELFKIRQFISGWRP